MISALLSMANRLMTTWGRTRDQASPVARDGAEAVVREYHHHTTMSDHAHDRRQARSKMPAI